MTFGKGLAAAMALVAAFAMGVWTAPYFSEVSDRTDAVSAPSSAGEAPAPAPRAPRREARTAPAVTAVPEAPAAPAIAASEPDVHKQLKPVMNLGTNMKMASEGFRDAEQFAMVAHAARNTQVPFMVLKHRVLEEGKSLAAAIAESNPDVDADAEAARARDAARQDLAEVQQARG